MPPTVTVQTGDPVSASTAYTLRSREPTYTTPSATARAKRTRSMVLTPQSSSPVAASRARNPSPEPA